MARLLVYIAFFLPSILSAQNSVLATGDWYKIGVTEDGLYEINRDFLQSLGIDLDGHSPTTIQIYGNGSGMLPQNNSIDRIFDLAEVSVLSEGLGDDDFGNQDRLLVYLRGPHTWTFNDEGLWNYDFNIYSDTAYYFVTIGQQEAKKVAETVPNVSPENQLIDQYTFRSAHEQDDINLLTPYPSGRKWFESTFSGNETRAYSFETKNYVGEGLVRFDAVGRSDLLGSFTFGINGVELGTVEYAPIQTGLGSKYDIKGSEVNPSFKFETRLDQSNITVRLDPLSGFDQLRGYLDRITLTYNRKLIHEGSGFPFIVESDENASTISIESNQDLTIWNITDIHSVTSMNVASSNGLAQFDLESKKAEEFFVFGNESPKAPIGVGLIENQNLKALSPRDGIIITDPLFLSEANRLAEFHRQEGGLSVDVVLIHQIYNEFSSGMQDIVAIRDAIRYFWTKNSTFRYVTLMGDCSYDYKNRIKSNTNFVPVYESYNSLDPVESYSSDDFYGFLEDGEGEWEEGYQGDHTLEVGIGRLPVRTLLEAKNVVDKIIRYATSERQLGKWKNNMTYVVDDGDGNRHMDDAEQLSSYFDRNHPHTSLQKLYLDAFNQEVGASNEQAPDVEAAILNAIEDGTFMVNYLGHGSEKQWAHERVLDNGTIDQLSNRYHLPVFMTATCEFGRYDDPSIGQSGAEKLLIGANGGAIALLTTSRPVYASTNYLVNAAFHTQLLETTEGEYPRLGDIMRETKNLSLSGVFNRNFALLGDPMLRLNYPSYRAEIVSINGNENLQNRADTVAAFDKIDMEGQITNLDGEVIDYFNGIVNVSVFDKKTQQYTLGQESSAFPYSTQQNKIFEGQATVTNGKFSVSFVAPQHISYQYETGKVILYAQSDSLKQDATGSSKSIVIGGTNENAQIDNDAPDVNLYLNDSTFKIGDVIGSNSLLFARISDVSGINTSGIGISQNITLSIDNEAPIIVNNYYSADIDTYQSGTLTYPLRSLSPGRHTIEIKVWDIHNNSTVSSVSFMVSDEPQIRLYNLTNYPNPASEQTTISFEHDRQGEELQVQIRIFDMMGSTVMVENINIDDSQSKIDDIIIDLPKGKLRNGIYLYQVNVLSTLDYATGQDVKRLMIAN